MLKEVLQWQKTDWWEIIRLSESGLRLTGAEERLRSGESLEDQTMNMAKSAARLFEENLKYSNGEPVKVVIADTTIGRVGEAAACAAKFKKEGVDITVTVTPCWCYGSETMDMDPMTIKGVWGFNGTERPGAVYLASVLATHAQRGFRLSAFMGMTCRMRMQRIFRRMWKKNCFVSDVRQ